MPRDTIDINLEKRSKLGEKIYHEIDKTNGSAIDYHSRKIIKYTWDDFTNLVCYEKENGLKHHYSAMIAINLMKKQIYVSNFKFLNGTEKNISIGDTMERIDEYMDELYLSYLNKIELWDVSLGVYFDQYVKLETRAIAERVGNFDVYGTGRNVRLGEENRATAPAIEYYEKLIDKDKTVVDSDKNPRRAHSTQKKQWHYIPTDMNVRPAEDLYILKYEEADDPDNPYLKDTRVNEYIKSLLIKVEDANDFTDAEKKVIGNAINAIYKTSPEKEYSNATQKLLVKSEIIADKRNNFTKFAELDVKIPCDKGVKGYYLMQQGYSQKEIAEMLHTKETNIYAYCRIMKKFIKYMESKELTYDKDRCIWYLGVQGELSARLTNALLRSEFMSIDEFKGMTTLDLIQIQGFKKTYVDNFVAYCKEKGVDIKVIAQKKIKGRTIKKEERIDIAKFCIANNYNYHLTSEKFGISLDQARSWTQHYMINNLNSSKKEQKSVSKENIRHDAVVSYLLGKEIDDICREYNITKNTFNTWIDAEIKLQRDKTIEIDQDR